MGGDSLAGSLGPALGERTAETGVVAPTFDSRVSSGLSSPEFFDWPEHATEQLQELEAEVVVFVIGTNDYTTPPRDRSMRTVNPSGRRSTGCSSSRCSTS